MPLGTERAATLSFSNLNSESQHTVYFMQIDFVQMNEQMGS